MHSGIGKELKRMLENRSGKLAILLKDKDSNAVLTQVVVDILDKDPNTIIGHTPEEDKTIKMLYRIWRSI